LLDKLLIGGLLILATTKSRQTGKSSRSIRVIDSASLPVGAHRARLVAHEAGHAIVAAQATHVRQLIEARVVMSGSQSHVRYDIRPSTMVDPWEALTVSVAGLAGEALAFGEVLRGSIGYAENSGSDRAAIMLETAAIHTRHLPPPWSGPDDAGFNLGPLFADASAVASTASVAFGLAFTLLKGRSTKFRDLRQALDRKSCLDRYELARLVNTSY